MPEKLRVEAPIPIEDQPRPEEIPPYVYVAINLVMADMAKAGVGKNQRNTQQNFQYRGVDDVMDALAPSLAKHGLIITPHVRSREVTELESAAQRRLFHTILLIDYEFIAARDGSRMQVGPVYGEAMDSGDKSTNKAMSAAYKYACTQTFCIPFSGDDPDAQTHEVAGAQGAREAEGRPSRPPAATAEREATPARPAAQAAIAPYTPREVPTGADGKPRIARPGGNFGYGKKHAETPWQVMQRRDLEWFLGSADRTPANIRERIAIELAWRDWETSTLDAARDQQRQADAAGISGSEDIP